MKQAEQEAARQRYGGLEPLQGATPTERQAVCVAVVMSMLVYGEPRAASLEQTVKAGGC